MARLPEVILTTTTSVDGRITLGSHQRLLDPDVGARWAVMAQGDPFADRHDRLGATAFLEGSGSFVDLDAPAPDWPMPTLDEDALRRDHLPTLATRWLVVADGRGRVDWQITEVADTKLHLLVCSTTPLGYVQRLHDLGVGYFIVGGDRVDLRQGLQKMRDVLGADRVVADAGGTLNASLLRQGLVDTLDVITLPGLVGGSGTPTMMDGPELGAGELPVRLELLEVSTEAGAVRTRYRVLGRDVRP